MIYICILYLKSLETYLETLHSHFQPNCYFKMFKNSGSGLIWQAADSFTVLHNVEFTAEVYFHSSEEMT
jgi:hypothetical protein